jgi:hypothetical protein
MEPALRYLTHFQCIVGKSGQSRDEVFMFHAILNSLRLLGRTTRQNMWAALWRSSEETAIRMVRETFPLQTTHLADVERHLQSCDVTYRLLTRTPAEDTFWRDKPYDAYLMLEVEGPMAWQGARRMGTVYDVKFYFKDDTLIDLAMGLVVKND